MVTVIENKDKDGKDSPIIIDDGLLEVNFYSDAKYPSYCLGGCVVMGIAGIYGAYKIGGHDIISTIGLGFPFGMLGVGLGINIGELVGRLVHFNEHTIDDKSR